MLGLQEINQGYQGLISARGSMVRLTWCGCLEIAIICDSFISKLGSILIWTPFCDIKALSIMCFVLDPLCKMIELFLWLILLQVSIEASNSVVVDQRKKQKSLVQQGSTATGEICHQGTSPCCVSLNQLHLRRTGSFLFCKKADEIFASKILGHHPHDLIDWLINKPFLFRQTFHVFSEKVKLFLHV